MPAFRHVLLLLPPDPLALPEQRQRRLPPQGAALVATLCGELGLTVRAVDLERSAVEAPLDDSTGLLVDEQRLWAAARGAVDAAADALIEQLLARVGELRADALLVSLERHTQLPLAVWVATAIKRRTGMPVALGGQNGGAFAALLAAQGVQGIDLATGARTPHEIRRVVQGLLALAPGRFEPAVEPLATEEPPPAEGWPLPDFGVYDLTAYRHPLLPGGPGPGTLVLPYTPSFGCAFRCAFCQDPAAQVAQPAAKVVADLATLGERWGARDFVFLSCQLNQAGPGLARAIGRAGLDVRWSDSWRVTPSPPGVFAELAAGGCVGLTFGVESGSRRMLQRMRKGHRPEDATRVVREAAAAGIFTRVNLLPCFPGETAAELAETVDWVSANARAIDDLAPSSFYLDALSPIGRDPERFGLRVRGARAMEGEDRFRKSPRAVAYDEVGGLSWEERVATLRPAEEALRTAWHAGRGEWALAGGLDVVSMVLLRRRHPTREAAYVDVLARRGRSRDVAFEAPGPDLEALAARVAAQLPPTLRAGLEVQRSDDVLLVRFLDGDERRHELEARLARVANGSSGERIAWAYRTAPGAADAARFVGSYRRIFQRLGPLDAELTRALQAPLRTLATPAAGELAPVTPHLPEGELVAAALAVPGGSGVTDLLARLAPSGQPARVFLSLENPCDQACEFCGLPLERGVARPHAARFPVGRDVIDSGAFDALLAALIARTAPTELCLTGHDWTLHPRLDALLQRLERTPGLPLSLYGPSAALADETLAARALALPGLREVRLTLHSPDPARHDAIAGLPGSGARVLRAIARVRASGVPLALNAVLTRRTVEGLSDLLRWLAGEGLRITLLAFQPDRTLAPFDGHDLVAPWSDVRAVLDLDVALAEVVIAGLVGLPACAVPPALRARLSATWNSARGEGMCFPARCEPCGLRSRCGGVARLYEETWGARGLIPTEDGR